MDLALNMLLIRSYFKQKAKHPYNTSPKTSSEKTYKNILIPNSITDLPDFIHFLWTIRDFSYGTGNFLFFTIESVLFSFFF